jgi:integrase
VVVSRPRALTPLETEKIRARMPTSRDALLAYAGLRPGEALALTWDSVTERVLIIDRNFTAGELKLTKTGRRRTVDLVPALADDLEAMRPRLAKPGELVVPARHGGPLDLRNWRRRVWQPACDAAKVTASPYDARHGFASLLDP